MTYSAIALGDQGGSQRPAVWQPSFELVLEVIEGLKSAGVKTRDIFVYDRYRGEFMDAGYHKILPDGIRWGGLTAEGGDQFQLDFPSFRNDPIAGYDPDAFVWMDLIPYGDDPKDDRKYRSHLGKLVTKVVNKIVGIPVLKDHGSAGVTGCLKNMSHGSVNNVARSHSNTFTNVCNQFIPQVVSHPSIRSKFVLQIMDGIRGVYQGGPFAREKGKWTWEYNALLLATDPVALDHVEWDIVDAKRVQEKLARTARRRESSRRSAGRRGIRRPAAPAHRPGRHPRHGHSSITSRPAAGSSRSSTSRSDVAPRPDATRSRVGRRPRPGSLLRHEEDPQARHQPLVPLLEPHLVEGDLDRIGLEGVGVERPGDHQDVGGEELGVLDGVPRLDRLGLLEDVGIGLLDLGLVPCSVWTFSPSPSLVTRAISASSR